MSRKTNIVQSILLFVVIVGVLLTPSLVASGKPSRPLLQTYKPSGYSRAWANIEEIAVKAVSGAIDRTKKMLNIIGEVMSRTRQFIDSPVSAAAEKILTNPEIAKFAGIQYHHRASYAEGEVNIYLVKQDGLLANAMGRVISFMGNPKAAGGTLYPIGIFINAPNLNTDEYDRVESHEYCHYYQQSVFGFVPWFQLYSGEILLKDFAGKNLSAGYKNCSWELAAKRWAEMVVNG